MVLGSNRCVNDNHITYQGTPETNADYSGARVCVIDTGVDLYNPDLNVVGTGYSFIDGVSTGNDDHYHGTHVAGTIGAIANNDFGVVGIAPNVEIVPIKVLDSTGYGADSGVIAAIDFLVSENGPGCQIANMSLGTDRVDPLMDNAVRCAAGLSVEGMTCSGNNIKFAIAAGNSATNAANASPASSSYNRDDNIEVVAAMSSGKETGGTDDWASFSSYGQPPVDYIMPGVLIVSLLNTQNWLYGLFGTLMSADGTSMAAPHMAGLLARDVVNGSQFQTYDSVQRQGNDYYDVAEDAR